MEKEWLAAMSLIDEWVKTRERNIYSIASTSVFPLVVVVELTVFEERSQHVIWVSALTQWKGRPLLSLQEQPVNGECWNTTVQVDPNCVSRGASTPEAEWVPLPSRFSSETIMLWTVFHIHSISWCFTIAERKTGFLALARHFITHLNF